MKILDKISANPDVWRNRINIYVHGYCRIHGKPDLKTWPMVGRPGIPLCPHCYPEQVAAINKGTQELRQWEHSIWDGFLRLFKKRK